MKYYIPNDIYGNPIENMILRFPDYAWIPFDQANIDYQKYLEWINEGNTPEPWEPEL